MKILIIAGVVCLSASALAQTSRFPPINLYTGDPTGNTCSGNLIQQSSTTGLLYTCQSGAMRASSNASISPGAAVLPIYPTSTSATLGPSHIGIDSAGNMLTIPGGADIQSSALMEELPNNTASGATLNALVCMNGSAQAQTCTTASTMWTGLSVGGATGSTGGNVQIARTGQGACLFDGTTAIGHYVSISSTIAGYCHDTGATTYPTSGAVIGRVLSVNGGSGTTATVNLYTPGIAIPSVTTSLSSSVNGVINPMAPPYNAACNLTQYASGAISAAGTILTGTGFTAALVGQTAIVWSAGAVSANGSIASLQTTVASYTDSTHIVLSAAATTAVTAGPYEIGTLDTAAIQNAINAAATLKASVLVPANAGQSCLTGTLDISAALVAGNPVPMAGQGSYVSSLTGLPGQDVLQWPDGHKVGNGYSYLRGLAINIDNSLDVSSATGGAGTFPNRITGQCANGSGGLTACTPAIAPGPVSFTGGSIIDSGGSNFNELTVPSGTGGLFTGLPSFAIIGTPVTVPGLSITATITAVIDGTHIKFTPAYSGTAASLTGTWGAGLTPPWYVGNCGFAIPASNGANAGGVQMQFEDLQFFVVPSTQNFANHTCGMFFQQPPYFSRFTKINFRFPYYGYIEALPTSGNQITWTPDTATYHDINTADLIGMVQYAGNHRIIDGLNMYGNPLGLGPFMLNGPLNNAGVSTVTHFYHEPYSNNLGENQRWAGNNWMIAGGSMTQGNGPYIDWEADQSEIRDAQIGNIFNGAAGLVINGSTNVFDNVRLDPGSVTDNGRDNVVISNKQTSNYKRRFAVNNALTPTGIMDGGYLATGNGMTPYRSQADLSTHCADWNWGAASGAACILDPNAATNGNFTGSYFTTTASGGYTLLFNHGGNNNLTVGYRLPRTKITMYVFAQLATAGTHFFTVKDGAATVPGGSCSMTFGTSLTLQKCTIDLTTVTLGDNLSILVSSFTGASEQVAWIDFEPYNDDAATQIIANPAVANLVQSGAGGNINLNASNWVWGTTAADATSPVGFSSVVTNASVISSVGGSSNLQGDLLYPAVNSDYSVLVYGPTVWTDTLGGAMLVGDTTMTITTAVTSAWPGCGTTCTTGYLQIGQEIVKFAAPTVGATSLTITRAQFGSLAQAHSNGATYTSVGSGSFFINCNSVAQANTNIAFTSSWHYWKDKFYGQNCSGYQTTFKISSIGADFTGQVYKIAAINLQQRSGMLGIPSAANQVPLSSSTGVNVGFNYNSTKAIAGAGAGLTTGPTVAVSGDVMIATGTAGQVADSGTLLSALASLASPTFTGTPAAPTATAGTNTTQVATTAFVTAAMKVNTCGTTTTCSNTAQTSPRIVWGTVTLSAGTATVGSMTAWTSTTSFVCTPNDTTTTGGAKITNASTTSITVTGGTSDVVGYVCVGN